MLCKHFQMVQTQLDQLAKVQKDMLVNASGDKHAYGIKTRSGITTQDPLYPEGHPKKISVSDAETESGNNNESPDKEEGVEEPEKHTKNTRYTKEDFIANKHGKEREPWVQKPMPFPGKKHKSKEEEHYNKFCEWMKPLFLQIPLTDVIKLPPEGFRGIVNQNFLRM